jgi:hypothetical protein
MHLYLWSSTSICTTVVRSGLKRVFVFPLDRLLHFTSHNGDEDQGEDGIGPCPFPLQKLSLVVPGLPWAKWLVATARLHCTDRA